MSAYVLVSGDFTTWGGMDRANYALAWHLADRVGASVHLVGHSVAAPLVEHPCVTWHRVPKPLNRYALGGPLLAWKGRCVSSILARQGARVVVNGGNCAWPDVNWVHAVHAAWENRAAYAPTLSRLGAASLKYAAKRAERRALRMASLVLTNSRQARQQVIDGVGLPEDRVHAVYYGIDPEVFRPIDVSERVSARRRWGWPEERPIVAFIGALGRDRNKGFDVLFAAWEQLCKDSEWDADLVVAGAGAEVEVWRRLAAAAGLSERVRMLGFTKQIPDLLAAADALVSPTRYDAYGLGVHEALCRGLPAFVTRSAGIAERYPADLSDLLLCDPPNPVDLAQRLRRWRSDIPGYSVRVARFGATLRQRTWLDMAREIVALLEASTHSTVRIAT